MPPDEMTLSHQQMSVSYHKLPRFSLSFPPPTASAERTGAEELTKVFLCGGGVCWGGQALLSQAQEGRASVPGVAAALAVGAAPSVALKCRLGVLWHET